MRCRPLLSLLLAAALLLSIATSADAELVERGGLFVRFQGGLAPTALPRDSLAPISVSVDGTVKTLSGERPPALRRISIELNRGGVLDPRGLPVCRFGLVWLHTVAWVGESRECSRWRARCS